MKRVISLFLSIVMMLSALASVDLSAFANENTVYRITLTWGASPRDLDSHLIGKDSNNNDFHLFYSNKSVKDIDGSVIASLDTDDTSGYGPENTTIFKSLKDVTYYFYVYNFSGSGEISGSEATVKIYKENDSSSKLLGTYKSPSGKSGKYWNLFQIKNGKIIVSNSISAEPLYNIGSVNHTLMSADTNNFTVYNANAYANITSNVIGENNSDSTDKYKKTIKGVTASYNNTNVDFDESINIVNSGISKTGVIFSKEGYQNYIVPKMVASSDAYLNLDSHNIYLYDDKKDSKPYISTVFARSTSGKDVRYKEVKTESLSIKQGQKYDIIVSAGDINASNTTYTLSQDTNHKISNKTGVFSSQELYSVFKENATIYAYVQSNGKTSETVKLQLTKPSKSVTWLEDIKSNNKFSLLGSDTTGITVNKDIPIIGGANIGMDLIDFPIGVEIENDTFKISLGVDVFDTSDGEVLKSWTYFKKCCDTYYVDENKTSDQIKKIKNTLLANQFGKNSTKKAALTGDLLGYIEGQIVNGNLVVTAFSGSVAVEFMFKYNQNFSIGPVPVYLYLNAGASASMDFTAAKLLNDDAVPFDFGIALNITPSVQVGGGAGVKSAASAGIWGKGSLPFQNNFSTKYRYLALKGEFGVEAELFCFKGSKTLLEGTKTIYDGYYGSSKSKSMLKAASLVNSSSSENETIEYSVMSRDYIKETSAWLGNRSSSRKKARSIKANDIIISPLKTSVFKNSKAQLVQFDDKLMLAWIDDDSSRDTYNRMKLVYSIYDNGIWSEPQSVYDDGHNDNAPTLISDGENVFVAWQKVNKTLTEEDSTDLTAIVENTEIYFSKYDPNTDAFVDTYQVTNNKIYDYLPSIAVDNGNAVLYFVSNNSNDLNASSANDIHYCTFNGNINDYKTGLNQISNLDCSPDSSNSISYIMDIDGNSETAYDTQVFTNGVLASEYNETSSAVTLLRYGKINNQNVMFYSDGLNIYYNYGNEVKSVFSSNRAISGDLNVLNSENNTTLVWSEITTAGTDLFTCSYSNGSWSEPVQLTNTDSLLSDVSVEIFNNAIVAVFDRTERTAKTDENGNAYYESGLTDLCQMTTNGTTDLAVSIPFIDESAFVKGTKTNIGVYVDNVGTETVDEFDIVLKDGLGNEFVETKQISLKSGESQYIELEYEVPTNLKISTLSVEVVLNDDNNTENNIAQLPIGNTDLSMGEIIVENVGDYYNVTGVVKNDSCVDAEDVIVEIRLDNMESNAINYSEPIDLPAGDKYVLTFTVDASQIIFEEDKSETPIFFTATTSTEEILKDNNTNAGVLKAPHEHTFSNEWTNITEATCVADGLEENICNVCEETVQRVINATGIHSYDDGVVERESTCASVGSKIYTCTVCSSTKIETIEKLPHQYEVELINPTCLDKGYTEYNCINCGNNYISDYVNSLGHNYIDGICSRCNKTEPVIHLNENLNVNIEKGGYVELIKFIPEESGTYYFYSDSTSDTYGYLYDSDMKQLASNDSSGNNNNFKISYSFEAGKTYYLGAKYYSSTKTGSFYVGLYDSYTDGHKLQFVKTVEPTCTVDGYDEYDCELCNRTIKNNIVTALGHQYVSETILPTCVNRGYTTYKCTICNNSYNSDYVDATGHNGEILEKVDPTCDSRGYTKYKCTVCSVEYTENFNALGHNYVDGICSRCNKTEPVIHLNENLNVNIEKGGYVELIKFIPEESGTYYFYSDSTSDTYGYLYDSDMKQLASNDSSGNNNNFKISYSFEAGKTYYLGAKYYSSTKTGSFYVGLFDSYTNGHQYTQTVTEPTCTESGYTTYTCKVCQDTYISDWIDPTGHNFVDKVCINCGEETLYLYFDASKISSVSFEPVSEYRIMENTKGDWKTDNDGNDYYFYHPFGTYADYEDGDKLIAVLNDGSEETFIYHHYSYDYQGFFNDKEEVVLLWWGSDQYKNHWTVGGENIVNLTVRDYNHNEITSTQTTVTIYENPYSFITYVPANEMRFIENMNGSLKTDGNGNEYYNYSKLISYGDQIILTTKDGESSIYTYRDDGYSFSDDYVYARFFNESNESVSVNLNHNQSEIHWEVGNQYEISVECLGLSTIVKASVVESPVKSIEFIPIDDKKIIEQTNGNWVNDNDGESYWYYDIPISNGDKLIVTNKDNSTVEYTYVKWIDSETNNCFISEKGDKISRHECFVYDQHINHWEVDKENYFTVEYMGVSCQVPVTIVKPDHEHHYIAEIIEPTCVNDGYTRYYCEFCKNEYLTDYTEPTGNHTYVNGFCKYCNAKDADYVLPTISVGETKVVNIENGGEYYYFSFTPVTDGSYIFSSNSDNDTYGYLYDENMNELTSDDDGGKNNNFLIGYDFEAGKKYIFGCRYYLKESTGSFDVSLIENNVASISFTPVKPYEIIENTHGRWVEDEEGNEHSGEYWRYDVPSYQEGDILTITDKNGNSAEYTYIGYSEDYDESVFENNNGDVISANEVIQDENQRDTEWTVGGENYFTVEYMGAEVQVPVAIVENPVESISYEPISPITVMDGVSYKLPYCGTDDYVRVGDKLTVNYKNGTIKEFVAEQNSADQDTDGVYFVSSDGESISLDRWNDDSTGISYKTVDESVLQFTYCGISTTVEMTRIFAEAITYNPVKSVVIDENDSGKIQEGMYWNQEDESGNVYTYYSTMPFWKELNDEGDVEILSNIFQSGDTLVVEYSNGEKVTYTYNNKSGEWGYIFDGDDNTELYLCNPDGGCEDELNIIDNQKTDHWTPGSNNWFAIKLSGVESNKVSVGVIKKSDTHTHSYIETITNPTCTEKGYTTYTCECGDSYVDDYVDAVGHNYGQWKYNGNAVYNSSSDYKNGTQTRVCSVCGEEETIEAPNTGLLRINTVSLSLESSITMNFKVRKSNVTSFDDFYVTFKCMDDEETVTEYTEQGDYYVFSYKGISPQIMNKDIVGVLHAKSGNTEYTSPEKIMSVKKYAYQMLDLFSSDENYASFRTMIVDLLNYGAASQIYAGYQTDNLVNSELTDVQKSWASVDNEEFKNIKNYDYKTIANPTARWRTSALVLDNSVMLRAKFSADNIENKTVEITCNDRTFTYTKNDFVDNGNGTYYVCCDELYADEMSDDIFLTVYENGVPCSNTMRFSIESYARIIRDNYQGSDLDKLTTAMMLYGKSARAYRG